MNFIDAIGHATMLALGVAAIAAALSHYTGQRARRHARRAAGTSFLASDPTGTARGYPNNHKRGTR